jgi:hypothetical protein
MNLGPLGLSTSQRRLSGRRKAVTIVAGFKGTEGVVLCADTQETVGISKRNVPKLRFEPSGRLATLQRVLGGENEHESLAVAFCGSTDNGPFLDMLIDKAWQAAQGAATPPEASDLIEQSIKRVHREYRGIYQTGFLPTVELIYGIKMMGRSALFHAYGPAVTKKDNFVTAGVGSYLADFLAERMYDHRLGLRQLIILAEYILFQAKEHVEGCGGDSHIAVLRNAGTSGMVDSSNVATITALVKSADKRVGQLLMSFANLGLTDQQLIESGEQMLQIMAEIRRSERTELEAHYEMLNRVFGEDVRPDSLGLPISTTPSTSGTSEPGQ